MIKNIEFFTKGFDNQLRKNKRIRRANIPYGSNIMPILRMYKDLSDYEEKKFFEAALEAFLTSQDEERRRFAVDICLGFLVFRDAI